nr:MFS transporter [Caldimonas sp.]
RIAAGRMVSAGLVLLAASFFLMLGVGVATSLLLIMAWTVVGRIGLGIIMPSLNLGAMVGLPHGLISHGSSTINFLRQLGGAVGIGLVGNFLEWRLHTHATAPIAAYHETVALVGTITAAAIVAATRMAPARPAAQPVRSS